MQSSQSLTKPQRLKSLDILRGLDLFLLLFFQPVFISFANASGWEWLSPITNQFDHVKWEGFSMWDLVMPLFLFMAGTALPFSLSKYNSGLQPRKDAAKRIVRRVLLLFILGIIVQGNILALNPDAIYLYSNTLQAIAAGYAISAAIMLGLKLKWQIAATFILMAVYSIPMHINGNFEPGMNFADTVDSIVLGRFRDGSWLDANGCWQRAEWYTYTWIWSSLNFGATVMSGVICGEIIRNSPKPDSKTSMKLVIIGIAAVASAILLSESEPIVKRIWTSTMVLLSSGFCFILMGIFYWLIDCKHICKGLGWLRIYGMNAITAYAIGETVSFRSIVRSLTFGLEQYCGAFYPVILTFGNFLILFLILKYMYDKKIYLKI